MQKRAKTLVHDCSYDEENVHLLSFQYSVFQVEMKGLFHHKHLPDSHTKCPNIAFLVKRMRLERQRWKPTVAEPNRDVNKLNC